MMSTEMTDQQLNAAIQEQNRWLAEEERREAGRHGTKTAGQLAYEEDVRRLPLQADYTPRPTWEQLANIYAPSTAAAIYASWERNPTARDHGQAAAAPIQTPRGKHSHRCKGCGQAVYCYKSKCHQPQRIDTCSYCR